MDLMNVEQAKIAEAAVAVAVMALERIPADIRRDGGVARMSDRALIKEIKNEYFWKHNRSNKRSSPLTIAEVYEYMQDCQRNLKNIQGLLGQGD